MCDGVPALGGIPLPRRVARNKEGDIVEEVDIGRTEMLAAQTMCPGVEGDHMEIIQLDILIENSHTS